MLLEKQTKFLLHVQQCEGIRVNAVPQETEIGADITQSRGIHLKGNRTLPTTPVVRSRLQNQWSTYNQYFKSETNLFIAN